VADAITVDQLQAGDHACLTFTDRDERDDLVAEFVSDGLARAQKVICYIDATSIDDVARDLALRQIDAEGALDRGQLHIRGGQTGWLSSESSADRMIATLGAELVHAAAQGFDGLRVSADMGWATRPTATVDQLVAFERHCTDLFTDAQLTTICQYDRERFDPVSLAFVADTHVKIVAALAYHDTPLLRICRQHRPPGIRIAGELDYVQAVPLEQALSEALRLDQTIHTNLTKLQFIDGYAATTIAQAALTLPADRRMVVTCTKPVATVFEAIGAKEASQLLLTATP